jgi:beta-lactamase class A
MRVRPSRSTRPSRLAAVAAALVLTPLLGCSPSALADAGPVTPARTTVGPSSPVAATASRNARADRRFAALEKTFDARLGVYALDTGTHRTVGYRAGERFAFASTAKVLSAANVLKQSSDAGLDRVITYTADDLVSYSPITEQHVATGMSLREICDAALRYSDNTAANLLFAELGGPKKLDAALERIGDRTTAVDRLEPELNTAVPGDVRDTSTPRALATDLNRYALGSVLNRTDRGLLTGWMRTNTTGDELIRAGVPAGWRVADKTGSAAYGTRNDIAVLWPPDDAAPIVLAVLSTRDTQDATYDNALIARATTTALAALTGS